MCGSLLWEKREFLALTATLENTPPQFIDTVFIRTFGLFTKIDKNRFIHSSWDLNGQNVLPASTTITPVMLSFSFFFFYSIAKEGSPEEKNRLKTSLIMLMPSIGVSRNSDHQIVHKILTKVLEKPNQFPAPHLLKDKEEKDPIFKPFLKVNTGIPLSHLEIEERLTSHSLLAQTRQYLGIMRPVQNEIKKTPENNPKKILNLTEIQEGDQHIESFFDNLIQHHFVQTEVQPLKAAQIIPVIGDKIAQERIEMANSALQSYQTNLKAISLFELIPEKQDDLTRQLLEYLGPIKVKTAFLKSQILLKINARPVSDIHTKVIGRSIRELTLEDLAVLCRKNDALELLQLYSYMSEEEALEVRSLYVNYLAINSRGNQLKRCLGWAKQTPNEQTTENLIKELQGRRNYATEESTISRLQFEHTNGIFLYKSQIKTIDEIKNTNAKAISAELATGQGKTKAINPNLMQELAGKNLVIAIHPATIEPTNTSDLKNQMQNVFGRGIDRFEFHRGAPISGQGLKIIYQDLLNDIQGGRFKDSRPLSLAPHFLKSLELYFLLTLKESKGNPTKPQIEILEWSMRILILIRVKGIATIDEEHINLSPKDQLIYTLGPIQNLPTCHYELLDAMIDFLLTDDILQMLKIRENKQSLYFDQFEEQIKEKAFVFIREWLQIKEEAQEAFRHLIFSEEPIWNDVLNAYNREQLYLARGLINELLKTSLKGSVNVSYGKSKLHPNIYYAISYSGNNEAKENHISPSQPKNPSTIFLNTSMTYLCEDVGLDSVQVWSLIQLLQDQAKKESFGGLCPLNETTAWKLFEQIAPHYSTPLTLIQITHIAENYSIFAHSPSAIKAYMKYFVWSTIGYHPKTIASNAQNFKSMFAKWGGFSATPPLASSLGHDVQFLEMKETFGRSLSLFLTKTQNIHVLEEGSREYFIEKTLDITTQQARKSVIIDVGAFFKGITGREIAEKIRERYAGNKEIEEIVFYDESQEAFVLMKNHSAQEMTIQADVANPSKRMGYYDQARSFGSDFELMANAICMLLVGLDDTWNRVAQGSGRARKLNLKQSLELIITQKFKEKTCGEEIPAIEKILAHLIVNMSREDIECADISQPQQIDNLIRRPALDQILGLPVDDAEREQFDIATPVDISAAIALIHKHEKLFFSTDTGSAEEQYGSSTKPQKTLLVLEKGKETKLKSFLKQSPSKKLKAKVNQNMAQLSSTWPKLIEKHEISEEMVGSLGKACDIEIHQIRETQRERQVEVEVHSKVVKREAWNWTANLNLFAQGWESPKRTNLWLVAYQVTEAARWFFDRSKYLFDKSYEICKKQIIKSPFLWACLKGGIWGLKADYYIFGILTTLSRILPPSYNLWVEWRTQNPIFVIVTSSLFLYDMTHKLVNYLSGVLKKRIGVTTYQTKSLLSKLLPSSIRKVTSSFDPGLLVSNNFITNLPFGSAEEVQTPFKSDQKPLVKVLLIEDTLKSGQKKYQVMMIDQHDSQFFADSLRNDRLLPSKASRKRKVALVDVDSGVILAQGNNPFNVGELQQQEKYKTLMLQARVLAGIMIRDPEELTLLEAWVKRTDAVQFKSFITDHVIARNMQLKEILPKTAMGRILGV